MAICSRTSRPLHWRLRDSKVDLRVAGDVRELYAADSVSLFSPNFVVPPNFTFELEWTGTGETSWKFEDKDNAADVLNVVVRGEEDGMTANTSVEATCDGCGSLGQGGIMTDTSKPVGIRAVGTTGPREGVHEWAAAVGRQPGESGAHNPPGWENSPATGPMGFESSTWRNVLVTQFGVDASRLSSKGQGQAQPIASNDTPDGRAANRRVEFIKQ